MSVAVLGPASRAIEATVDQLASVGIVASRDSGAFFPQPLGVLVGLPAKVAGTLATLRYLIPVHVVSADPLTSTAAVDALYLLADQVADALGVEAYAPEDWRGGVSQEALPSVRLDVPATVTPQ